MRERRGGRLMKGRHKKRNEGGRRTDEREKRNEGRDERGEGGRE